tara:strand:- start:1901 stop:2140 length:240 start_codon:yes stop_codon:yes gene_type:complete
MELKDVVDFAYSMTNMDEVKNGKFSLPKEIVFSVKKNLHEKLHREIRNEKHQFDYKDLDSDFDLNIFGINFKFKNDDKK